MRIDTDKGASVRREEQGWVTMDIKICGHKVRWRKPIKIFTFVKASTAVLALCALFVSPVQAADPAAAHSQKASTCVVSPCSAPSLGNDMRNAPAMTIKPQHKPQRSAGPSSTMSPAMALAMALGVRNVRGPVEYREPVVVRRGVSKSVAKQVSLLSGDGASKKSSMNAAAVRLALED